MPPRNPYTSYGVTPLMSGTEHKEEDEAAESVKEAQEVTKMEKKTKAKVKAHTRRRPKKAVQKKVTLTKANAQAYKKKYPITFFKLAMMVGDPKKKTLTSRLPDYNAWLQYHDYDNEAWFRSRNKSKKDW